MIEDVKEKLEADDAILCLTDPKHNFRLDVLPTYKTHRKTVRKPLVLMMVKDWLVENHGAKIAPGLEGDDLMGILATMPHKDERIIVSIDKDMKTIPGKYVRTRAVVDETGAELVGAYDITDVSPFEANCYFLKQTLSGDVTDGYDGCPGIGATIADKIIDGGLKKVPYEHTFKSGPRKGTTETRYTTVECDDLWECVVSHYQAAGLGEEEAIRQARCARILRASDYNLKTKEVILWTPT
jgi:DNA polymerase-1